MKPEEKGRQGKALSRREFLKNSAIGAAGVAAGSLLAKDRFHDRAIFLTGAIIADSIASRPQQKRQAHQ